MMNQQFFCDKKVDSQQHEVRQIISDTAFCRKYVKLLTLYNKMCYNKTYLSELINYTAISLKMKLLCF